jgi:hypothetical protein
VKNVCWILRRGKVLECVRERDREKVKKRKVDEV